MRHRILHLTDLFNPADSFMNKETVFLNGSLNHWRCHSGTETDKVVTGYTNFFISTDRLPSQTGKYQQTVSGSSLN